MAINWVQIYNRLFEIINSGGDAYYGGTRFLDTIREVNYNVPTYKIYIQQRQDSGKSSSRKDYYYDLLMEQPELDRIKIVEKILDSVGHHFPEKTAAMRQLLGQSAPIQGPQAVAPQSMWNADRLNEYLEKLDKSIDDGSYEYTLTLAYTCLEGFYKAFIKEKVPSQVHLNEILPLSIQVRNYIKAQLDANNIVYPDLALTLISTVTSAIANARNNFSDSHSGNRAEKWLAIYIRDNVNAVVKLMLNFL